MNANVLPSALGISVFQPINSVLNSAARQAILRPQNPPPGIAGFLFDIPEEESIQLTSEITDNFLENNTSVTDQIALHPERFTVRGMVAELSVGLPTEGKVAATPDALPLQADLTPPLTPAATQAQVTTAKNSALESAALASQQSLWGYFNANANEPPGATKQAKVLRYFMELWRGRQFFTVETPWGTFTDMAIESLRASQPEDTQFWSSFQITFKKLRFAGNAVVLSEQLAGRLFQQEAPMTQDGTAGKGPVSALHQSYLKMALTGRK